MTLIAAFFAGYLVSLGVTVLFMRQATRLRDQADQIVPHRVTASPAADEPAARPTAPTPSAPAQTPSARVGRGHPLSAHFPTKGQWG